MSSSRRLVLALAGVTLTACAHAPAVQSGQLPLRRVVVYRNGVGYFERQGHVDGDQVGFQVKKGHVGDFLATLAVMEKGGSSVRSASFPIHVEEPPSEPVPQDGSSPPKDPEPLEDVQLGLSGGEHDLTVGYVAEQPVWRPSYRLVFTDGGPQLQAWGIVQNLSGEDWNDVSLSLVAGAPIAFRATLGTPVTPERPVVNDQGETITRVPVSETTLERRRKPSAPPPPPPMAAPTSPRASMNSPKEAEEYAKKDRAGAEVSEDMPEPGPSMPADLSLLAAASVQAGATRYDLPKPVTIPDDSATMVLLIARPVPGEESYLFAPEGGVPDSSRHPFHVARFKNVSGALLERGPIAIFEHGAFLGQGLLAPLAAGAEATVPFALERALAVDSDQRWEQQGVRLARIEAGALTLERDQVLRTTYRIQNGSEKAATVIVRHPRQQGMRLAAAPEGTDDQVGEGKALVPVQVAAAGEAKATVDERRATQTAADWLSPEADLAVKGYLADKRADPKLAAGLESAWALRESLRHALEGREKLDSQRSILQEAASQTRESLHSIARNKGGAVEQLRTRLTGKLTDLERQLSDVSTRLVELDLKANELKVRFQEAVRALSLAEPLPLA